jgi:MerR family transcriptional regulator, thiopeptide resistance regulator
MYIISQLADLAGVSVRTLHYYDEIGLLRPSSVGENGYRYYDDDKLLRLQQILFYREMGLGLLQIKEIVDSPEFDLIEALQGHRQDLERKIRRLRNLINTIDITIDYLKGESPMSEQDIFGGFSEEQQKKWKDEAMQKYDPDTVKQSWQRWESYGKEKQEQIKHEGNAIYGELVTVMGKGPESPEVQAIIARWHQHIRYFYEPTPEVLRGLGHMYNQSPDFMATFEKFHADLPGFLESAITYYCDNL